MGSKLFFFPFSMILHLGIPPLLGLPLNSPLKADPLVLLLPPRLPKLQKPISDSFNSANKYLPGKS